MSMPNILRSTIAWRLAGTAFLAVVGASLERVGWSARAVLGVVVFGVVGLGALRQKYGLPPIARLIDKNLRAKGAGA